MIRRLSLIIAVALIVVAGVTLFFGLPLEISRRSDIRSGNELVQRLEKYMAQHNRLPDSGDWKVLEELGFEITEMGTKPAYEKLSDGTFELIYLEGFDGPYLFYNSVIKKWSVGWPETPNKTDKTN